MTNRLSQYAGMFNVTLDQKTHPWWTVTSVTPVTTCAQWNDR